MRATDGCPRRSSEDDVILSCEENGAELEALPGLREFQVSFNFHNKPGESEQRYRSEDTPRKRREGFA